MGDPETSVAASSSSPPPANASESAALSYAFLVHSQKTLTQNLPPRVDNKLLARQKRRRTRYVYPTHCDSIIASTYPTALEMSLLTTLLLISPEDHAILEAEYRRNPKPDKVARTSIVSRVALGEKEVQVCCPITRILCVVQLLILSCTNRYGFRTGGRTIVGSRSPSNHMSSLLLIRRHRIPRSTAEVTTIRRWRRHHRMG